VVLKDRHLTLEQFLELSPKLKHVLLQRWLADRIDAAAPGSFVALPELRVTFGGQSYVPDLSVFRWARLPVASDGEWVDDIVEPPDVVVEVVSPKQSVMRLLRRCISYVRNGVAVALLVDSTDRSVVVLRPGTDPVAARGAEVVDLTDVVPDLRFAAGELFSALRPS
jgi:Uma2 family endonuclease